MNPAEYREAQDTKMRQLALMQTHAALFPTFVRDAGHSDPSDPHAVQDIVSMAKLYGVRAAWVAEFEAFDELWSALHMLRTVEGPHDRDKSAEHLETEVLLRRKLGKRWIPKGVTEWDGCDVVCGLAALRRHVLTQAIRVLKRLLMGEKVAPGPDGDPHVQHWTQLKA